MNYGQNENLRVKNQIVKGLFKLLKKEKFSEISISKLIKTAGVARASYYRNFDSKEDILEFYFNNLRKDNIDEISSDEIVTLASAPDGAIKTFRIMYKKRKELKLLLDNNLGDYIYRLITEMVLEKAGDMPADSIERYKLYFFSGAMFSVLVNWINSGAKESPEEISKIALKYLQNGI
ncbi:TetR/AcrR family transcriptional regulator [Fructilactobacillus sp. Tb1]|uniref:TetR/AcrR family transcriptional regulator n=1 Tax=Fructilactobacillus sp. Tb1 TaxID=3422304 RepID=UPI003D282969